MRLVSATVYALEIPLVETFRHSARARSFCDSVVVRVWDEAGTEGFGEGVPRPYVTGETTQSMVEHVVRLWSLASVKELPSFDPDVALQAVEAWLPPDSFPGKTYTGWVGFISPTAEFTPKAVETTELRT